MIVRSIIACFLSAIICAALEPPIAPKIQWAERFGKNPAPQSITLPNGTFAALFDGQIFPGKFLGIDPTKGTHWQHPAIQEPCHIKPDSLGFLQLKPTAKPVSANCEIHLLNDDRIVGNLISLDEKSLTMDAAYCGRTIIPRTQIRTLIPRSADGAILIKGFAEPKDWMFTHAETEGGLLEKLINPHGRWTIKDGAAFCAGGNGALFGRKLPDNTSKLKMEFDFIAVKGDPQFSVQFFTDNLNDRRERSCIELSFRKGKASAKQLPGNPQAGLNGRIGKPAQLPAIGKRAIHVTIHATINPPQIHLALNGRHLGSWHSENPLKQFGTGILFIQRGKKPIKIENLIVRKSHGSPSSAPSNLLQPNRNLKKDHISFTNNDHIDGELIKIADGKASFKSSFGIIDVQLTKIQKAQFAQNFTPKFKRAYGSAVITLANQTQITGQVKSTDNDALVFNSQTLGGIKIPLASISTIDFQTPKKLIPGFPDPNAAPKKKKDGIQIPRANLPDFLPPDAGR